MNINFKSKIMNAQEARERAKNIRLSTQQKEMSQIRNAIESAVNSGQFKARLYFKMDLANRTILIDEKYLIDFYYTPDGPETLIRW